MYLSTPKRNNLKPEQVGCIMHNTSWFKERMHTCFHHVHVQYIVHWVFLVESVLPTLPMLYPPFNTSYYCMYYSKALVELDQSFIGPPQTFDC